MKNKYNITPTKKIICPYCRETGVSVKRGHTEEAEDIHNQPIIFVSYTHDCKELKNSIHVGWTHSYGLKKQKDNLKR